jgi:hypothetical protein
MDWKFIITTLISAVSTVIAFLQYRAKKEEEKKIESLKVLVGVLRGWREYIQSAVNANIIIRNSLRGRTDEDKSVSQYSSLQDVIPAVESHGSYLNGLHVSAERQISEIKKVFGQGKKTIRIADWLLAILMTLVLGLLGFWLFSQIETDTLSNSQSIIVNSFIALKFPVDILGALVGGVVGLLLVLFWDWISRPRVSFLGFNKVNVNFGDLYKLRFKLSGRKKPGICQLEIQWNGKSVKAKWDEAPNPLKNDDLNEFRPELVPATFYQTLFIEKEYQVPILHEDNGNLSIFSGWWFGRNNGYGDDPTINEEDKITLILSGNNFQWRKTFKISKIIDESN